MSTKQEIEVAIIPKGSKIQIMGCSYTLLEDVKVDGIQSRLDYVLKAQDDFESKPKSSEQVSACKIKPSDWMV